MNTYYLFIFLFFLYLLLNNYLINISNEYFDIIWNYPSRINNYIYDIRGNPENIHQYCLTNFDNISNKLLVTPCLYNDKYKYDIYGSFYSNI